MDQINALREFGLTEQEKELRRRTLDASLQQPGRALEAPASAQTHVLPRAETTFGVRDFPVRQDRPTP